MDDVSTRLDVTQSETTTVRQTLDRAIKSIAEVCVNQKRKTKAYMIRKGIDNGLY